MSKIAIYVFVGLFMAGLASTFFLDDIVGDPIEFRLLNKLPEPIYVRSGVVDLNEVSQEEILVDGNLYQLLPPGKQLVLTKDYTIVNPEYVSGYHLSLQNNSVPVVVNHQLKELFMTDVSSYKVKSVKGRRIFIREITPGDFHLYPDKALNPGDSF